MIEVVNTLKRREIETKIGNYLFRFDICDICDILDTSNTSNLYNLNIYYGKFKHIGRLGIFNRITNYNDFLKSLKNGDSEVQFLPTFKSYLVEFTIEESKELYDWLLDFAKPIELKREEIINKIINQE